MGITSDFPPALFSVNQPKMGITSDFFSHCLVLCNPRWVSHLIRFALFSVMQPKMGITSYCFALFSVRQPKMGITSDFFRIV